MTKQIKEIIVVEGRDDTKRLRQVFPDIETIETQGSAINDETLDKIQLASDKRGVIVFTDPDFNGNRIRTIINQAIPEAKQAFLPRKQAVPKRSHGSLGVEHASDEAIKEALESVIEPETETISNDITQNDLIRFGLIGGGTAKVMRQELGDELHIGYANGKQLLRRLNTFRIKPEELARAMKKVNEKVKK